MSLPPDLIGHILTSDLLPEPRDLGRLRAVCKGMRGAVDATGREIKKLSDDEALALGYVSLLKDRYSRGLLADVRCHYPCAAAAKKGDLQELKALRAKNFPWNLWTCVYAASRGHFEVFKWAVENGCPWDRTTYMNFCCRAAKGGLLEMLKWARANGCPWDEDTCAQAAERGELEVLR